MDRLGKGRGHRKEQKAALAVHMSFCPSKAVLSSWLALQDDGLLLCRWHQEPSALQAVLSVQGPEAVHMHNDGSFFLFLSVKVQRKQKNQYLLHL